MKKHWFYFSLFFGLAIEPYPRTIAHKTGYIGTMLGNAGIIEMPNGKRYIGAVIVESDRADSAWDFVPEVSQTVYTYFNNQSRFK